MNYEIVNLKEKTVVGISARTSNKSPEMEKVIGGLWYSFFQGGVYENIENKTGYTAFGIYSDYEKDEEAEYTVTVACQVEKTESLADNTVTMVIPQGKYAKFIVKGNMQTAVADFWQKLWKMDLQRTFVCDFEEYMNNDPENAEIHIYIGIK